MRLYCPLRCGTLLIPSGAANQPHLQHLFVLLTDLFDFESNGEEKILLAPFCTVRQGLFYDRTRTFTSKDKIHPSLVRDSFVNYRFVRAETTTTIIGQVNKGVFAHKESIDEGVVLSICDGLLESPHTARKFKTWLTNYRLAEGE